MDMQERALAYLDDEILVQLTRDLVRICSINPPGDEAAVATCVAERFERTHRKEIAHASNKVIGP